ncbi:hypothetical protein TNCV_2180631 [Trichonephila clavipes]|uniref:Uncharacterized protein n=1 Tax=Trichonephila clavipes TaxID=2585209 RepID=A0A8X7B9G3_TRICX|nr:hypothetical protein TNCV_2180631 [Trichonephila clavipes]
MEVETDQAREVPVEIMLINHDSERLNQNRYEATRTTKLKPSCQKDRSKKKVQQAIRRSSKNNKTTIP